MPLDTSLMTTISLCERLGSVLVGRGPGALLREEIEDAARAGRLVIVDFEGVGMVSPSFADELFAKIDPEIVAAGNLHFKNLDDDLREIVAIVRHSRDVEFL